jgi:hypothetical protein
MIRSSLIAGTAIAAALAVGGAGFASAASPAAQSQTLRVRETITAVASVDAAPAGLSAGDESILHLRITSLAGKPIGVNNAVCTVLAPVSAGLAHCVGTGSLPGGTIEWGGDLSLSGERDTFVVTGGTGVYRDAAGQINVRYTNPPTNTKVIVTIRLAG